MGGNSDRKFPLNEALGIFAPRLRTLMIAVAVVAVLMAVARMVWSIHAHGWPFWIDRLLRLTPETV